MSWVCGMRHCVSKITMWAKRLNIFTQNVSKCHIQMKSRPKTCLTAGRRLLKLSRVSKLSPRAMGFIEPRRLHPGHSDLCHHRGTRRPQRLQKTPVHTATWPTCVLPTSCMAPLLLREWPPESYGANCCSLSYFV